MPDLRTILAVAQQQRSIPGLLSMLRGGDPQVGGGGRIPQSVASTMQASDAMGGGGGNQQNDQYGWSQAAIAAPPEGWQSQKGIYDEAGAGNGWLFGNNMENRDAYEHTKNGPQMPYGIDPFTDIEYGPGSGQEGQQSGFYLTDRSNPNSRIDLFGGHQFPAGNLPRDIPQQLQSWLAPALMKHFYGAGYANQGGSGMNAPWTRQYAPSAPDIKTWPGVTKYDPWGRSMGELANYSS